MLMAARILGMIRNVALKSTVEKGKQLFHLFITDSWLKISHFDTESGKFEHELFQQQISNFRKMKTETLQSLLKLLKTTPLFHPDFEECK